MMHFPPAAVVRCTAWRAMAMTEGQGLPYSLKALNWDTLHHFNSQNKYGYQGKPRVLADAMLQCDMCEQWYFLNEVACVPKDANFQPFQRNYRFSCKFCAGVEQFELQTNTWTSIVLTAIYNLLLSDDGTSLKAGVWLKVKSIVDWLQANWGSLTTGRDQAQMLENSAVPKCLLYTQNSGLFTVSEDRSEVLLRHVVPSKLQLKPLISSQAPVLKAAAGARKPEPADKGGAGTKRKRGAAGKRDAKEPSSVAPLAPPPPNLEQIKLPDKYRLLPVPKAEMSAPQDTSIAQLSRIACAPQIKLRDDESGRTLTAIGYKGYRMVRATHGVSDGCYYYEVKVGAPLNDEDGHVRIGWSTEAGDVQAPVGYDANSYSYRDVSGTKFHESLGSEYGEGYGAGDVIGCMLVMGSPAASRRERQRVVIKGVEYVVEEERSRTPSVGSYMAFYKNGLPLGPAFTDVWAEVYYPAASLYKAATLTFNFGPKFAFPPTDVGNVHPISSLAAPPADEAIGDADEAAPMDEAGDKADEAALADEAGGEADEAAMADSEEPGGS